MRPIACDSCGHVFEGEKGDQCPRCALIDAVMPSSSRPARSMADELPRPVVIPGPSSPIENTLVQTTPPSTAAVERFAAETPVHSFVSDETDCPRCAEKIKVKAKMCRYCHLDLAVPSPASPSEGRVSARRSSSRFPALEDLPRRQRVFRRLLRPAEMIRFQRGPAGETSNVFLILAVVFGVVGLLVFPMIFGILAIVCGAISCAVEGLQGIIGVLFGLFAIGAWWAVFGSSF